MFVTKDLFLKALESLAKVHYLNLIHIHFISVLLHSQKQYKGESIPLGLCLKAIYKSIRIYMS